MERFRPLLWLILLFFFLPSLLSAQGVVVEIVAEASALEKAGVREGDVFHTWTRPASPPANPEPAEGTLESPFDWQWLEIEQALDRYHPKIEAVAEGRLAHALLLRHRLDFESPLPPLLLSHLARGGSIAPRRARRSG